MDIKTTNIKKENENWNLAILTFVILIFLFFWFYKFLFVIDPTKLSNPIEINLTPSDISQF